MSGRRWSFRTRLTALIAGVFILGGAVLLTVQYVLVQQLLTSGIATITSGCITIAGETPGSWACSGGGGDLGSITVGGDTGDYEVTVQQTTQLSQDVLSGLLTWSIVVLVAFAGVAILAAWWLSKRSLGRIARITETTREITREDLHRRLDLAGPDDEVKELGDTIDGMLDRLDDAFTRQDRFIAGASHELRTPLTTTRTLLEIPLAQGRVPAELEPAVRGALDANERSERLIAALLTLARTRHASPSDSPVDLHAIAVQVLEEREPELTTAGLRATGPGPVGATAAGEAGLVRIAIANLIDNAIRHNRDRGEVVVRVGHDAGAAWIEVTNDGDDLTGTDLAALTEPFHRGAASRLAGDGLGLGLALVETIARSQGGSLQLTARAGGGLRARLVLPGHG